MTKSQTTALNFLLNDVRGVKGVERNKPLVSLLVRLVATEELTLIRARSLLKTYL